ncbi:diguanylate phosphodiesterase, partial [Pseudomonas syringae]|nr:diguanylate phosphodiesterase [Pseudomonas syringae]
MNPQGYEHDHVIPTNNEEVAKVLQAAAHSVLCTDGLLMVSSATGWEQIASFGANCPEADEAWLRMVSSYGDVVLVGQDSPASAMHMPTSGSSLIYVAIRGVRQELLGAMLLSHSDPYSGLSVAQRYALQAHAANLRTCLQPEHEHEASDPRVGSFERLRLLESVVINANDAILI